MWVDVGVGVCTHPHVYTILWACKNTLVHTELYMKLCHFMIITLGGLYCKVLIIIIIIK